MPFIYRVQHEHDHMGPFRSGTKRWYHSTRIMNDVSHPTPESEELMPPASWTDWYSGCESIQQLLSWFTTAELQKLYQMGFFIAKIQASRVKVGKRQVIFDPASVTKWDEVKVSALYWQKYHANGPISPYIDDD